MPDRAPPAFTDQFDFTGRTVCVTGAAGGIGGAIARNFVQLGAFVYGADRDRDGLQRLAKALGERFEPVVFDQAKRASLERLARRAARADILANNAGVLLYEPLLDLKWRDLERVVDINLVGAIALTRLIGAGMVKRRRGVIIHTGSQVVFNGAEFRSAYAASKAGITQFVKTAALEWGRHGVRVNCVAPGRTLTAMNRHLLTNPADYRKAVARVPLGRFGQPQDIANAVVFMASDAASYITGHTLVVDGGWILP